MTDDNDQLPEPGPLYVPEQICECGEPLRFDAGRTGTTVGGLHRRGWWTCDACGRGYLPSRATLDANRDAISAAEQGAGTWTLAKGGRSLNAGPIRLRAEAHGGGDVAALMTRLVRVPELEREVETLRKLLREACYTLDAVGQQSVADRIRADLPETKETP